MAMTPKEELIQVIEQSLDELVRALLELLRVMQRQQSSEVMPAHSPETGLDKPGYDFSDLAGRLTWQGDAVTVQRTLRDEW
jgi:hypothetical protein